MMSASSFACVIRRCFAFEVLRVLISVSSLLQERKKNAVAASSLNFMEVAICG